MKPEISLAQRVRHRPTAWGRHFGAETCRSF